MALRWNYFLLAYSRMMSSKLFSNMPKKSCHQNKVQMLSQEKSPPPHQDNAPGFRSRCTIPLEWRYTSRIGPDWWSHWINFTNQRPTWSRMSITIQNHLFQAMNLLKPIPWGPQRCCSRSASKSLENPIRLFHAQHLETSSSTSGTLWDHHQKEMNEMTCRDCWMYVSWCFKQPKTSEEGP